MPTKLAEAKDRGADEKERACLSFNKEETSQWGAGLSRSERGLNRRRGPELSKHTEGPRRGSDGRREELKKRQD